MARTLFVLPLLFCAAATAAAQTAASAKPVWPDEGPLTWKPTPTTRDITATDLRTRLYGFADDSMSGRRIGEPGNYKGTDYIAREFKRFGLKPAGDNGTYFQEMPFGPMRFDSTTSRFLIAGAPSAVKTDWIPIIPSDDERVERQGEHRQRADRVRRPMGRYRPSRSIPPCSRERSLCSLRRRRVRG